MGRHDYIFGQFRETARCATWGRGLLCFSITAYLCLALFSRQMFGMFCATFWGHMEFLGAGC